MRILGPNGEPIGGPASISEFTRELLGKLRDDLARQWAERLERERVAELRASVDVESPPE